MSSAKVTLSLDKRSQKSNGEFPVKLIVYFERSNKRYGLSKNISLTIQQWEKINSPRLKQDELTKVKNYLETEKGRALKIIQNFENNFSYESFESSFFNKKQLKLTNEPSIYQIFEDYINDLRKEKRIGTAESYETAMKSIKSFVPELNFKDITPKFLEKYEYWMLENKRSISTIGIYLRSFRTIVNVAKSMKLITDETYPFGSKSKKKYEIPAANNIKKAINIECLKKMKEAENVSSEAEFARDMWFFSLHCNGMNMKDIFSLKYKDIIGDFFYFHRQKTIRTRKKQEFVEVYITAPIGEIFDKWGNKNKSPENYIFNIFNDSMSAEEMYKIQHKTIRQINGYMKRLGNRLNIDTKLTTYVARHSWATLLKNLGTSIEEISESLGHTSIKTTKDYLDSFPKEHKKETANKLTALF